MRSSPWRWLAWGVVWLIFGVASSPPATARVSTSPRQGAPAAERTWVYMLQNPLIRRFFTSRVTGRMESEEQQIDPFFVRIVDGRIRLFGEKVDRGLSELLYKSGEALRMRERWMHARQAPERREAAGTLALKLREVADRADGLADLLQLIFRDLPRDGAPDLELRNSDAREGYLREMTFIEIQVEATDQMIRGYLFGPGRTVNVEELRSGNMLMRLDLVESVANRVADEVLR